MNVKLDSLIEKIKADGVDAANKQAEEILDAAKKEADDIVKKAKVKADQYQKKAEAEATAVSQQRKHRGVLRRELEWLKRGPKARGTKQKARIQRIQDMQETEFKADQGKVEISTPSRRIGKKVIELNEVSKSYDNRTIVKDFTYQFNPDDRIGIITSCIKFCNQFPD